MALLLGQFRRRYHRGWVDGSERYAHRADARGSRRQMGSQKGIGGPCAVLTAGRAGDGSWHLPVLRLHIKAIPRAAGAIDFDVHRLLLISGICRFCPE